MRIGGSGNAGRADGPEEVGPRGRAAPGDPAAPDAAGAGGATGDGLRPSEAAGDRGRALGDVGSGLLADAVESRSRSRSGPARRLASASRAAGTPARPADPRVGQAARKMNQVAGAIRGAKADGTITDAEEARVEALAKAAVGKAQALVKSQGEPAVRAAERVLGFLRDGRLTLSEADIAIDRVVAGRKAMVDEAAEDRRTNPFRGLGPSWRAPFHGVRARDFRFEGRPVHVIAIDLADPRVQLQTNGPGARGKTVEQQARAKGAEVAINGDFFTFRNLKPSGPARTNGVNWGGKGEPMLAFKGGHADIVRGGKGPEWASNIVAGRPMVLRDGAVTSDYRNDGERTRRTGVGLSQDGRVLYLVAGPSLDGKQLGRLMKRVGAWEGLSMDGGGSAQMYQAGRGMVQPSSVPGGARGVANTVLIQARRRTP